MSDFKPTICIDFDGVIHSYEKGWQGGVIYGDVVPGFFEWAQSATQFFEIVIYSSRSSSDTGRSDMMIWLEDKLRKWNEIQEENLRLEPGIFSYPRYKPAAWLTIDDRAICFRGDWSAPELSPDSMRAFKPWNVDRG